MGMGKQSAPPAPDYTGAANQQYQYQQQNQQQTTQANRVNQQTPFGSLTYSQDPSTFDQAGYSQAMADYQSKLSQYQQAQAEASKVPGGMGMQLLGPAPVAPDKSQFMRAGQWTARTSLTPQQQQLLDAQQGLSQDYIRLAKQGVQNLPQMPQNAGQTTQDVIMSRLQPQMDRQSAALDAKLANQGITAGSQAYATAHQLQDQQHNDLMNQAALAGVTTDMQARNEAINQLGALRGGSQAMLPTFQNVPLQQQLGGPDLLGAMNAQYQTQLGNVNAQNAQTAGMFGTLGMLGGAYLMGPGAA